MTYQALAAEHAMQCPHCGGELILAARSFEHVLIRGTGRSQTVSLGGMSIIAEHSFAPGKELLLQFSMLREMISVQSKVVLSQRISDGVYRLGLEFLDLNEMQRQVMGDFFAENLLKGVRDRSAAESLLNNVQDWEREERDEMTDILFRTDIL